jgi:hypothetical protein
MIIHFFNTFRTARLFIKIKLRFFFLYIYFSSKKKYTSHNDKEDIHLYAQLRTSSLNKYQTKKKIVLLLHEQTTLIKVTDKKKKKENEGILCIYLNHSSYFF